MQDILKKDKYIIYNEDFKVLVFISTTSTGHKHISIPGIIKEGYENIDSTGEFYIKIIDLLIKEEPHFLTQVILENDRYKSINNKLKKVLLKAVRTYYSYYKELKKEDYEQISKLSYEKDIEPYFLSITELKQLILDKSNKKTKYNLDSHMKESLDELEKKLQFIKY